MKTKLILFALFTSLLVACGGKEEKKKESIPYKKNTTTSTTTETRIESNETIDLNNKGIGPITKLEFDDKIDNDLVEKGIKIFKQKCVACHKTDKKFIGPALKGIYQKRSPEWVMNMILNPSEMLKKDPIAKQLLKKFNNVLMIEQNVQESDARALAEYFRSL